MGIIIEALQLLGIKREQIVTLNTPLYAKTILVPEMATTSDHQFTKKYEDMFNLMISNANTDGTKVPSNFETISFPEGKLYEDMGTTYKLLKLASEVVFLDAYDYAYLQRPYSIMNSSFNLKKLDIIEMVHEMENDILAQFPNLACQVKNRAFAAEMKIFLEIPKKKEFEQAQKKLWHEIKENRKAPFMTKGA